MHLYHTIHVSRLTGTLRVLHKSQQQQQAGRQASKSGFFSPMLFKDIGFDHHLHL